MEGPTLEEHFAQMTENELKFLNYYPFLISPNKHITHHETKQNCYSAPILDIDFIIKYFKNNFN